MQVIDNEICYRAKEYLTVHKLFYTRADLHRTVYTHAKVKAIELMFVDALVKADNYLHISSFIHDPSQYWKLDDSILKTIETNDADELQESRDIIKIIGEGTYTSSAISLPSLRISWTISDMSLHKISFVHSFLRIMIVKRNSRLAKIR